WWLLIEGLVSVAAGLVAFFMPRLTALTLVYVIAAWAIITGVLEIAAAIRLRKTISNEWWLVLSGVLSIVFGGVITAFPGAGALALVFWIGAYALVFGAMWLALALRLRRLPPRRGHGGVPGAEPASGRRRSQQPMHTPCPSRRCRGP